MTTFAWGDNAFAVTLTKKDVVAVAVDEMLDKAVVDKDEQRVQVAARVRVEVTAAVAAAVVAIEATHLLKKEKSSLRLRQTCVKPSPVLVLLLLSIPQGSRPCHPSRPIKEKNLLGLTFTLSEIANEHRNYTSHYH